MSHSQDRYAQRGVSSSKSEVHAVVDHLDRGVFPGAFCKIGPDILTGDDTKCNIIHSDGSGTKSTSPTCTTVRRAIPAPSAKRPKTASS